MNNIKYILSIVFPIFFGLSVYAQNSPKTKIRLFEQTTVFDSVVSKNDSIYIYAGDTVFKTQIADADWYKVGTTSSPSSINDSVYTLGQVGIGTAAPANQLHIAGGTNPIKAEGLQPAQINDTTLLVTNPADGTVRYLRLDSIFNKEGKLFYAAEYAGGVFDTIKGTAGNHSGFMTSNNAKAPDYMNFYEWFTPKATLQSYDIVLRLEAPLDFASWTTTTIDNMAEASGSMSVEVRNVTQGTVINPITNLSNAAWTTTALNMNTLATNPEDIILIIVTMNSVNSDFVRAGDVKLRYNK